MKKVNLILDVGGVIVLFDKTKKNADDLWASEKLNQELLNYLLANKNKYLYLLLTNNYPDIEKLLVEKFKLPKFYESIVNSADVGFAKPGKEIYHHALAALNAKPEDCIFVDDSAVNVEAARVVGMRGIVYTNFAQFKNALEADGPIKRRNSILIPYRARDGVVKVYLQRRAKDAERLPDHFGFFGGGAEGNETPERALLREIKEELDYTPRGYRFFGEYEFAGNKKWVYFLSAPDDFESKIRILEGQYGKWFTDKEIAEEPLLIEDDKKILRAVIAAISTESQFLGKTISVVIDRPLGSKHPKWGFVYEVNYGYVPNTKGSDGEEVDAYVLGVRKPLKEFTGRCIAIIHRLNDNDDKLVLVPNGKDLSDERIREATSFQEQFFKSTIVRVTQSNKTKDADAPSKTCAFYVVRHGETHANAKGFIQGQSDFVLTENGEEQAANLAKKMNQVHFAAAFSSDLVRARRTAEIITLEKKLAINTSHLLRERNFGKYEGKPQELFREENREFLKQLATLPYEEGKKLRAAEDIENDDDLTGRFITFLREIAVTYQGKTVLVVTHAGVMRAFLRHISHDLSNGFIENAAYFRLRSDGINFFVDETSGITTSH